MLRKLFNKSTHRIKALQPILRKAEIILLTDFCLLLACLSLVVSLFVKEPSQVPVKPMSRGAVVLKPNDGEPKNCLDCTTANTQQPDNQQQYFCFKGEGTRVPLQQTDNQEEAPDV
jgi:hypothetical protein